VTANCKVRIVITRSDGTVAVDQEEEAWTCSDNQMREMESLIAGGLTAVQAATVIVEEAGELDFPDIRGSVMQLTAEEIRQILDGGDVDYDEDLATMQLVTTLLCRIYRGDIVYDDVLEALRRRA
jgi:hypothetical protein